MEKKEVFQYIESRWPDTTSGHLAKVLVDEVYKLRDQEAECLSYGDLLDMAGLTRIDPDFQAALTILTAGKCPVLQAYGIFVDEEGEEYPLRGDDFSFLLEENALVHPQTGEFIENASHFVAPVFEKYK